jgi:two-component system sensor histidine kinase SenX3
VVIALTCLSLALAITGFLAAVGLVHRRRPETVVVKEPTELPLLTVLATAVLLIDASDEVRYANPAAASLGLTETLPADLRAQARSTRRDGQVRDADVTLRLAGTRAPAWVRAITHRLPDGEVALFVDDVTESRRVEAVRRDFVANVGHEIKTPVGAIELLVEAAQGAGEDLPTVRRFLERLRQESTRLSRLVTEILDLSRLQGGDPLPVAVPVRVRQLVSEAIDRAETAATAKAIRILSDVDELVVGGSEAQLVTALTNLLDNAVAYSAPGTTVAVTARAADGWAEIAVADQGAGMDPAETGRIFERFYRIDPARSRATGGTGLGLAIVKHIVSNHGGEVRVWSRPGSGSTFTLRLPLTVDPSVEVVA